MGWLSSIFGDENNTSQSTSNVTVTVNPNVNVASIVDLGQLQGLVDHLSAVDTRNLALTKSALDTLAASQVIDAAEDEKQTKAFTQFLGDFQSKSFVLVAVIAIGAVMFLKGR